MRPWFLLRPSEDKERDCMQMAAAPQFGKSRDGSSSKKQTGWILVGLFEEWMGFLTNIREVMIKNI